MRTHASTTYFETQSAALNEAFSNAQSKGYTVNEPNHLWSEHIHYGKTVHYNFSLIKTTTGNPARTWLHISIYRMDSGRYELTYYYSK